MQSQAVVRLNKALIIASIDIPATNYDMWTYTEVVTTPVVEGKIIRWLDVPNKQAAKSGNKTTVIDASKCLSNSKGELICKLTNPISEDSESAGCLGNIILTGKWHEGYCKNHLREAILTEPTVIRQNSDEDLLVLSPGPFHFEANCSNGWKIQASLKKSSSIVTTQPCQIKIGNKIFNEVPTRHKSVTVKAIDMMIMGLPKTPKEIIPDMPRISEQAIATMEKLKEKLQALSNKPTETKWVDYFTGEDVIQNVIVSTAVVIGVGLLIALWCFCCCC